MTHHDSVHLSGLASGKKLEEDLSQTPTKVNHGSPLKSEARISSAIFFRFVLSLMKISAKQS